MQEPFVFKKIDTPELLDQAFRLRYQVYCRERNFIDPLDYPSGYESDEHDLHSLHFGALDSHGQLVGAVRLILPSCENFPIEEKCPSFNFDDLGLDRRSCAEISRLAISKDFRRETGNRIAGLRPHRGHDYSWRKGELPPVTSKPQSFIFQVSSVALGLCRAMHYECRVSGITHCLALMEKPLWMLLHIHGFVFWPLGPEIDFYGKVTPYLIDIRDLEKRGLFKASHGREVHIQEN